jgi:hypothetical protein
LYGGDLIGSGDESKDEPSRFDPLGGRKEKLMLYNN